MIQSRFNTRYLGSSRSPYDSGPIIKPEAPKTDAKPRLLPDADQVDFCHGTCELCGQRCTVRAVAGHLVAECPSTRCRLLSR